MIFNCYEFPLIMGCVRAPFSVVASCLAIGKSFWSICASAIVIIRVLVAVVEGANDRNFRGGAVFGSAIAAAGVFASLAAPQVVVGMVLRVEKQVTG